MVAKRRPAESVVMSLPAPVGGWNARDSLANMDPADAVQLENWFPGTSNVNMRYGYTNHTTGITGAQVESLMVWNGPSSSAMIAATNGGKMYTVTNPGAVGAAAVSGLSNGRWQHENISTTGGNYLVAVNGSDKAVIYDGTYHRDGDGAPYDVTGVNTANCINVNLHKNRLWFVQKNTLDAWYMPTAAIGGAATKFSLNAVAQKGGSLIAMYTWTIDAGYGVDDNAVFVTSEGEVIVYSGTDPASAATWALIGVWQIGTPVGYRPGMKYAGDLLLITQDGVVPMSGALQSSRLNPRVSLTDKIQWAMSMAVDAYGGNFGWELIYFAQQNQLYLNVPVQGGASQEQYVMNTITKSWCKFSGQSANCWAVMNDNLYFGGFGIVAQAWNDYADASADITGTAIQAFNYLGNRSQQKQFTMIRPTFFVSGQVSVFGGVNVDFDTSDISTSLQTVTPAGASWDAAVWDVDVFGPDLTVTNPWQGANGIGYCCAPRIKATVNGNRIQWASSDVVFRRGGVL